MRCSVRASCSGLWGRRRVRLHWEAQACTPLRKLSLSLQELVVGPADWFSFHDRVFELWAATCACLWWCCTETRLSTVTPPQTHLTSYCCSLLHAGHAPGEIPGGVPGVGGHLETARVPELSTKSCCIEHKRVHYVPIRLEIGSSGGRALLLSFESKLCLNNLYFFIEYVIWTHEQHSIFKYSVNII